MSQNTQDFAILNFWKQKRRGRNVSCAYLPPLSGSRIAPRKG